jgi:hypothetical protein
VRQWQHTCVLHCADHMTNCTCNWTVTLLLARVQAACSNEEGAAGSCGDPLSAMLSPKGAAAQCSCLLAVVQLCLSLHALAVRLADGVLLTSSPELPAPQSHPAKHTVCTDQGHLL